MGHCWHCSSRGEGPDRSLIFNSRHFQLYSVAGLLLSCLVNFFPSVNHLPAAALPGHPLNVAHGVPPVPVGHTEAGCGLGKLMGNARGWGRAVPGVGKGLGAALCPKWTFFHLHFTAQGWRRRRERRRCRGHQWVSAGDVLVAPCPWGVRWGAGGGDQPGRCLWPHIPPHPRGDLSLPCPLWDHIPVNICVPQATR